MAKQLQRQIDSLKQKILFVGTLVEEAIAKAISALVKRDRSLAQAVIAADDEIDRMEVDVEEEVLKINNDLERMGDLAQNIAKRVVYLTAIEKFELPTDFRSMASKTQTMVKQSLDALVNGDATLARKVRDDDDEVDELKRNIQDDIERQIAVRPELTEALMRLLSVSRHLERLADMATNIAEDVIYMVEGEIVRHNHAESTAASKRSPS